MLNEMFVKELVELARKAATPVKLPVPADPRADYFVVGGEIRKVETPEPPRAHSALSLDDLIALANRFAADKPVVWFSESRVVLVIDDAGHRVETATLPLEYSDVWVAVRKLRERPKFSQKDFCRLLRVDLAGTLPAGALLNVVKALDFSTAGTASGRVDRTSESFGKSIAREVRSEHPVPEHVELEAPVYKTRGESARYPVGCAVEIDLDFQTLQLIPLPDEVERVEQAAVASVRARLAEELAEGVPAYYGKP
jgi:hypothetical protein